MFGRVTAIKQKRPNNYIALLQNESLARIQQLTKVNVDPANKHEKYSMRHIAIIYAAECNRVDVLEWLVNEMHCPIPHFREKNHPVIAAIKANAIDAFKWLLEKTAEVRIEKNRTISECYAFALEASLQHENIEMLKLLMMQLKHVDAKLPLISHPIILAIKLNKKNELDWLIENYLSPEIEQYCIEACIHYNNLTALELFFMCEYFTYELGSHSLFSPNISFLEENITTYLLKNNRFDMFIWYLDNCEHEFKLDLLDKYSNTIECLIAYFNSLTVPALCNLQNSLESAFDEEGISNENYAKQISGALTALIEAKLKNMNARVSIHDIAATPDTNYMSLSGSPKYSENMQPTLFNWEGLADELDDCIQERENIYMEYI